MGFLGKAKIFLKNISNFPTRIKNGYLQYYNNGWRWVHRTIAQIKTGRKIQSGHEVHHINRQKLDNNPENLQILSKEEHRAIHQEDLKRRIKKRLIKNSENRRHLRKALEIERALQRRLKISRSIRLKYMSTGCSRCGGSGYLHRYRHHYSGVCFRCSGGG